MCDVNEKCQRRLTGSRVRSRGSTVEEGVVEVEAAVTDTSAQSNASAAGEDMAEKRTGVNSFIIFIYH